MLQTWGLVATLIAISSGAAASATQTPSAPDVRQAFDIQIPNPPVLASVNGALRLAHELHLTSFSRASLTLTAVIVSDEVTGAVLLKLDGDALATALSGPGIDGVDEVRRTIATGRRAVIFLDGVIDGALPEHLVHRIEFDVHTARGREAAAIDIPATPVRATPLPVLGPPLTGGPWAAVYDPRLENGHRRYVYAVNGRARIPGRFAIDWMAVNGGRAGDPAAYADAPSNTAVLAVADGIVSATRDGVAEIAPGAARPPLRLADAPGNFIAVDIGSGMFAFYEHLAPGLRVRPGDRVRRGQVIARLGSTGQASRPHLHFHLADANAPVAAEGQPYALEGYRRLGSFRSIAAFESGETWRAEPAEHASPTFPDANAVVMFETLAGSPTP